MAESVAAPLTDRPGATHEAEQPSFRPPPTNALAIDTDLQGAPSAPDALKPSLEPPATISPASQTPTPPSTSSVHTPTEPSSSSPFTPTRIAPPSPAASRRASGNLSRGRSRAGSATSAATGSSSAHSSGFAYGQGSHDRTIRARPPSTLIPQPGDETVPPREDDAAEELVRSPETKADDAGAAAAELDTPVTATPHTRLPPRGQVVIRDFGFAPSDERYHGIRPPDVSTPASAASSDAGRDRGGARESSFGGWRGFSLGGFGWGSLRGLKRRDGEDEAEADAEADLEAEVLSPSSSFVGDASQTALDLDDDDGAYPSEDGYEDDEAAYDAPPPGPEPKGLYRVVYAFEAVGQYEMAVDEGEEIDVSGRGGGLGWVLARRRGASRGTRELDEGLVPESYIEVVRGGE